MFKNQLFQTAAVISVIITVLACTCGIVVHVLHTKYCKKYEETEDEKIIRRENLLRFLVLILFFTTGLFFSNAVTIGTAFYTAKSHGFTADADGKYTITYGEMLYLNRNSVKETDIDVNDLKGKAVIYVRYDCPDCVMLHSQLAELDDMIFLSSRTDKGKSARELYSIVLTEVPQGVYIDENGKATVINIMQGQGDNLTLDLQQIAALREMSSHSSEQLI